jgi:hypothetical protein
MIKRRGRVDLASSAWDQLFKKASNHSSICVMLMVDLRLGGPRS